RIALSSLKYARRSLWPKITVFAPTLFSIFAEISPVKAPSLLWCIFWATTITGCSRTELNTWFKLVNGGAIITTTFSGNTCFFKSTKNISVSDKSLFILQFPATTFFLISLIYLNIVLTGRNSSPQSCDNFWIQPPIYYIHKNIDQNKQGGNYQYRTHNYRQIQSVQRIYNFLPQTVPPKNVFHKHRPGQHGGKPS